MKLKWTEYTMSRAGLITTIGFIALMIYDLVEVVFLGTEATVSTFLKNVGIENPMLTLGIGFILGHLFGPMKAKDAKKQ